MPDNCLEAERAHTYSTSNVRSVSGNVVARFMLAFSRIKEQRLQEQIKNMRSGLARGNGVMTPRCCSLVGNGLAMMPASMPLPGTEAARQPRGARRPPCSRLSSLGGQIAHNYTRTPGAGKDNRFSVVRVP